MPGNCATLFPIALSTSRQSVLMLRSASSLLIPQSQAAPYLRGMPRILDGAPLRHGARPSNAGDMPSLQTELQPVLHDNCLRATSKAAGFSRAVPCHVHPARQPHCKADARAALQQTSTCFVLWLSSPHCHMHARNSEASTRERIRLHTSLVRPCRLVGFWPQLDLPSSLLPLHNSGHARIGSIVPLRCHAKPTDNDLGPHRPFFRLRFSNRTHV